MDKRFVTIDTGDAESTIFELETSASAVEVLSLAMTLGYLTIPAGTISRQGQEKRTAPNDFHVLASRVVAIS